MSIYVSKYYVWCVGTANPVYSHDTEDSAVTEAKRLAAYKPGERFIVVKSIGHAELPKPRDCFTNHEDSSIIPF